MTYPWLHDHFNFGLLNLSLYQSQLINHLISDKLPGRRMDLTSMREDSRKGLQLFRIATALNIRAFWLNLTFEG